MTARANPAQPIASSSPVDDGVLLRAFLDLPAGVLVFDRRGHVLHANRRAHALLGLAEGTAEGRPLETVLRAADQAGVRRIARDGHGVLETTLAAADGAGTAVGLHATPLGGEPGAPAASVLMLSDLTEARRLEEQIRRKDRLASLGQLSAGIAHEIKNPLAGIATCTEVLRNRLAADDARREFLDLILHEVTRLTRIVDTFIQFARPAPPRLALCAVDQCAEIVLALVRETIDKQAVRVVRRVGADVPSLYIDRDQIVQVLLNVVLNALQAMPEGGSLTLDVALVKRAAERRSAGRRATDRAAAERRGGPPVHVVEVRVSDTGAGVPLEIQPRLFDPFFTSRPDGTGLGLPIALSIVREHGGAMSLASTPGRGTTVTIELPVEKRRGPRRSPERAR